MAFLVVVLLSGLAIAASAFWVLTILPGSLNLTKTPVGPGVFGTTVLGDPSQGGKLYVLYVRYTSGARSAPAVTW